MVNYAALLPIFAGLLGVANAHSRVYGLWVNDVDQGDGRSTYIRSPPNNSPVKDVSSTDIICNAANVAAPSSVSVSAGDKITFGSCSSWIDLQDNLQHVVTQSGITTTALMTLSTSLTRAPSLFTLPMPPPTAPAPSGPSCLKRGTPEVSGLSKISSRTPESTR